MAHGVLHRRPRPGRHRRLRATSTGWSGRRSARASRRRTRSLMASHHPAVWHGLSSHGAIAPGYVADLLLLPDLVSFQPSTVLKDGRPIEDVPRRRGPRVGAPVGPDRAGLAVGLRDPVERRDAARDRPRRGSGRDRVARARARRRRRARGRERRARPREDRRRRAAPRDRPRGTRLRLRLGAAARRARVERRARRAQPRRRRHVRPGLAFAVERLAELGGGSSPSTASASSPSCPLPVAGLLADAPLAEVVEQSRACNDGRARPRVDRRDAVPDARLPRALRHPEPEDHRPRARRRRPLRDRPARGCEGGSTRPAGSSPATTPGPSTSRAGCSSRTASYSPSGRPATSRTPTSGSTSRGAVVTPGLVNTHHHLYQTLTRARAQQADLFSWLRELYPVWAGIDAEAEYAAARTGLAELALSGCSTVFDHHYVFPRGSDRARRGGGAGGAGARRPDRRVARLDGPRRLGRRPPTRRARRGHRRGARGHRTARRRAARDRPRSEGPDRRRAVLAVLRDQAADDGVGRARPPARAHAAHAPGGDPRGGGVLHGAVRRDARRVPHRPRLARARRLVRALRPSLGRRHGRLRLLRHGRRPLPDLEPPARGGRGSGPRATSTPGSASGSAWTARRRTSEATSSPR